MNAIGKELVKMAGKALADSLDAGEVTAREVALMLGYGTPDRPNTTRVGLMRRGSRAMSLGTFLLIWRQTENELLRARLQAVLGFRDHLHLVPDPTINWPAHLSAIAVKVNNLLQLSMGLEEEYAKAGNQPGPKFQVHHETLIAQARDIRDQIEHFGASVDGRANLKLQRKKARPFRLVTDTE